TGTDSTVRNGVPQAPTRRNFHHVYGLATIAKAAKAIENSVMPAVVCVSMCGPPWRNEARYTMNVGIAHARSAGIAKRSTRLMKPGLARSNVGASARKNAGTPIVNTFSRL